MGLFSRAPAPPTIGAGDGNALRDMLSGLVRSRATGRLTVTGAPGQTDICLLFGNLFNAQGAGGIQGEAAIMAVVDSSDHMSWSFDARSKLPGEQTVSDPRALSANFR